MTLQTKIAQEKTLDKPPTHPRKNPIYYLTFATKGRLAEWLGKALQKLVRRFESATDLSFHFKTTIFTRPTFTWLGLFPQKKVTLEYHLDCVITTDVNPIF